MKAFKNYDVTPYTDRPMLSLLKEFHDKYGLPYDAQPRSLPDAELQFRLVCHREECDEYRKAVKEENLVEALDALADEIYFLTGTAHRQGFKDLNVWPYHDRIAPQPGFLARGTQALRDSRHETVLRNYATAATTHTDVAESLWKQKEALREALQAFYYTAALHGFDIHEALLRVHAANMAKDVDPTKQRRTQALKEQGIDAAPVLEITKPEGWLAPWLGDLAGEGYDMKDAMERRVGMVPEMAAPYDAATVKTGDVYRDFLDDGDREVGWSVAPLCGLITIDGPDASGKSTLAARIAEVTGGQVIHLTWSKELETVMDDYRTHALHYAAALAHDRVVILERPWLSHVVYSEVYRKGEYDADAVHSWQTECEQLSRLDILALPGDADVWLNNYARMCDSRFELHGPNLSKARAVYAGFRDYFSGANGESFMPGQGDAALQVYDMQAAPKAVDIDAFIREHVLPHLLTKGNK